MNAADWLRGHLQHHGGRAQALQVMEAAAAAGYTSDRVKRAKRHAGVVSRHPDITGPWYWELNDAPHAQTRSEPICRGCRRTRPLTQGHCETCAMALARAPQDVPRRTKAKTWAAWS